METLNTEQIQSDLKAYAKTQYDLLRLNMVGSLSRLLGSLVLIIAVILIVFAVLSFCAFAAIGALASCMPMWAACLIMAGIFIILMIVLIALKQRIFVNMFVKRLSAIFFASDGRKAEELRLRKEAEDD